MVCGFGSNSRLTWDTPKKIEIGPPWGKTRITNWIIIFSGIFRNLTRKKREILIRIPDKPLEWKSSNPTPPQQTTLNAQQTKHHTNRSPVYRLSLSLCYSKSLAISLRRTQSAHSPPVPLHFSLTPPLSLCLTSQQIRKPPRSELNPWNSTNKSLAFTQDDDYVHIPNKTHTSIE